jgi:hypothetical protein
MILLLGEKADPLLQNLFNTLTIQKQQVLFIEPPEIVFAKKWLHTIGEDGVTYTEITLLNNIIIKSTAIKCLYNRMSYFQLDHFTNASDRQYAGAEFYALFLSFLKSIETKVINPIQTNFLAIGMPIDFMYKKIAIENNIAVVDEVFTSSPKWHSNKNLGVYDPNQTNIFSKKAPQLIFANLPVLLKEKEDTVFKVYFVNNRIFSIKKIQLNKEIKAFAQALKKDFLCVDFIENNGLFKLKKVIDFPLNVPQNITTALAESIIKKSIL